jgi:hypothetical protein
MTDYNAICVVSLATNVGEDAVDKLDSFVHEATCANGARSASVKRLERQGRALTYSLSGGISTSEVFAIAEEGRKECNVEEYGNVFIAYVDSLWASQ